MFLGIYLNFQGVFGEMGTVFGDFQSFWEIFGKTIAVSLERK